MESEEGIGMIASHVVSACCCWVSSPFLFSTQPQPWRLGSRVTMSTYELMATRDQCSVDYFVQETSLEKLSITERAHRFGHL
jgi:hypothetical protein